MSTDPTRPMPQRSEPAGDAGALARQRVLEQQESRKLRRHPVRRWVIALFTVFVVVVLLVIGDRVANAVAENDIAEQIQSSGFPLKPSVTITGFPFLTQVAAHDIHQIDISASNIPAGPIELSSLHATATGVHLNSGFNGGTVDQINGTALVTFAAIASASGGSSVLSVSAAGSDTVAISAGGVSIGDAKISITGANQVSIEPVSNGGIVSGILGAIGGNSFNGFSFTVPKLPAGLQLKSVSVSAQGVAIGVSAHDTQLSQ